MSAESWERAWRDERARIVGSLARRFGDLGLAEDAVQEAFATAHRRWSIDGEPDRPGAWLHTVATRQAIAALRKQRSTDLEADLDVGIEVDDVSRMSTVDRSAIDDDLLGLLLACCHPALDSEARIALTLRHVCGLTVDEISAGFVIAPATMAKRLVRARRKIKDAGIPFRTPDAQTVHDRLDDIHTTIYVVFTEGHLSSSTGHTIRTTLCEEAIWLARQIVDL